MKTKRFGLFARLVLDLMLIVVLTFSQVGQAFASPVLPSFTPSDGQAATLVLGQPDFTSNTPDITQTGMHGPTGIAVDPASGKIFVADCDNNRVLRFASVDVLTNGAAAEAVLGQPDFTSNTANTTQNGMYCPDQISIDSNGRLWVADYFNSRVLRFDNAASKANGADADGVLGQPDFTTSASATTQNGMYRPEGVFADADGRVWVTDTLNHRILRFDNAAAKADGADADGVLGQPDFTSNGPANTQTGMSSPLGVYVDSSGRVWVTDIQNNRVLRFDNAAAKANGANADGVLGQPDFTSNTPATTQSGMQYPVGVAIDAAGGLYVSEGGNNRILVFENAATLANGADASNVLGQTDFIAGTPNTGGISAATLSYPYQLFYDPAAKVLWVTEYFNHRVLMYGTPDTTSPSTRYVATTGADSGDCSNSAGPCASITYAISQAVAGNTISIAAGTYTEAGIIVNKNLSLGGAGASSTIVQADVTPGTATNSVFIINSGVTATIDGMTIQNGNAAFGGGIRNEGTLTLNNSTVSGNLAGDGGGIFNGGSGGILTLNNSTISGNSSSSYGGGIFNFDERTLTLNYSTVTNNTSDSDNNSKGNGGGILNNIGTVNLKSSMVAGNKKGTSGTTDATADCGGTLITSQGYNVTGSGTGCNLSGTGDVTVTPENVFTDVLGVLANNGGATQTHALIVSLSNPALNAIPNGINDCGTAPFDFDQRGAARPFNINCDIGAYEAQSAAEATNTPPGTNVQTQPVDTNGGTTPVTLTFAQVTQGGTTSLTTSSSGPPPSIGFKLGNPPTYYELSTTAVFSGPVTICINYTGINFSNESSLKLNHYENGAWVNHTISLDTANNIICASVTSLSPFAIFEAEYQFSGFFQPVDNLPTLNVVKAGSAIPVKFSLNGDQGLNIFAAGYPVSGSINCNTGALQDAIEVTVTAGNSSLSYNAATDTYTYIWKTDKAWTGCRQLVVRLNDGTDHVVNFKFK